MYKKRGWITALAISLVACVSLGGCVIDNPDKDDMGSLSNRVVLSQTLSGLDMVMNDLVVKDMSEHQLDMIIGAIDIYKDVKSRYSHYNNDLSNVNFDTLHADWVRLRNAYKTVFFIVKSQWMNYSPELQTKLRLVHLNAKKMDDNLRRAFELKQQAEVYANIIKVGGNIAKVLVL